MKFLVPLLGILLCSPLPAQTQWRLSDPLGRDLGPAAQGQGTKGWVLRVEPRLRSQERVLFQDGKEQSVRLVDVDPAGRTVGIRDLRGGLPIWEVTYDAAAGVPVTETSFEGGQPSEMATLEFEGRILVRRTVKDDKGQLVYRDTLGRWPDGTLRRLERDGPDGPLGEAAWSYGPGGRLTGSWSADAEALSLGEHREVSYRPGKTLETLATAADVLETRVTEELASGETRETRADVPSERTLKRLTDSQGRLIEETLAVKDVVTQTKRWTYDDRGRVTKASTDAAGPPEVWTYEYQDGTVVGRLTRGGVVAREEVLKDGEKVTVRLFDRGVLFLVETWTGGRRTKETYYQKGVVVRERSL